MGLPIIPADKANHACYGGLLAALGMMWSSLAAACLVLAFGVAKELHDHLKRRGTANGDDLVATIIGGAVVLFPYLVKV